MKYIKIEELGKTNNKIAYIVKNKKGDYPIGEIYFYSTWRQYCFFPLAHTVYSYECLQDITNFILKLKKLSEAGKSGAKTGKVLKDKIAFEPNGPPPLFIKEYNERI